MDIELNDHDVIVGICAGLEKWETKYIFALGFAVGYLQTCLHSIQDDPTQARLKAFLYARINELQIERDDERKARI